MKGLAELCLLIALILIVGGVYWMLIDQHPELGGMALIAGSIALVASAVANRPKSGK